MVNYCMCGRVEIDHRWYDRRDLQERASADSELARKLSFSGQYLNVYPRSCDVCRPYQAESTGSNAEMMLSASTGD